MEKELEQGISLGEIFHVMFIKKWLFLGVSLGIMFLGTLFILLFYNPGATTYDMIFDITFPGISNGVYPDGKMVVYRDFVSEEMLLKVQATDEDFASIDIEKLTSKDGIVIGEETEEVNEIISKTGYLVIQAQASYFKDEDQGRAFVSAIAEYICDYAIQANNAINLKYNLEQSKKTASYSSKVGYLIAQKDVIVNGYNDIINSYSNAYTIDGVTILQAYSEINEYFSYNDLDALYTEIKMNGYVNAESDFIYSIEREIENLEREYKLNEQKIAMYDEERTKILDKMTEMNFAQFDSMISSYNNSINDLKSRNIDIRYTVDVVYKPYLESGSNAEYQENLEAFEARLDEYYNKLAEFTETYIPYKKLSFEDHTYTTYKTASRVSVEGGIGIILALPLSLILGCIAAGCLNLVLDMPKYLRNKKQQVVKQ